MGDQAHLESTPETVLKGGNVVWWTVAGQHDLSPVLLDGVERVEEFFLEAFFTLHELDVVYQKHVVSAMKVFELREFLVADRFDEAVHEGLAGDVMNFLGLVVGEDVVPNRLEEVGLT